jgi:hypothetical protein
MENVIKLRKAQQIIDKIGDISITYQNKETKLLTKLNLLFQTNVHVSTIQVDTAIFDPLSNLCLQIFFVTLLLVIYSF